MKVQALIFIGAQNSFQEIRLIVDDINSVEEKYEILGLLDDNTDLHGKVINDYSVLGGLSEAINYSDCKFVFGIGSFNTRLQRKKILEKTQMDQNSFVSLVHPTACVYPTAKIAPGCIIYPRVTVCGNATLKPFVIATYNAVIAPNVTIEPYAMITTNSTILTEASIGESAFVGVGSIVGERVNVGAGAVIVMGSTVFHDVGRGAFFQGNPARHLYTQKVPEDLT